MTSRRRAPAAPSWRVPDSPADDDWNQSGVVGRSTRAQAAATVAARGGLWAALGLALVLGLVNCAAPAAGPPTAAPAAPMPVPPPSGCAELVVAGWLAGDDDLLAGVVGMPRADPETDQRRAALTFAAEVIPGEAGWTYLVGAQVQVRPDEDTAADDEPPPEPWQDAGVQFFAVTMVPVVGGCQGWAPAALPAQVAGPSLASPTTAYPVSLPASGTELAETLAAFFTGLLTSAGNPERYVAPGTVITFPDPPPYLEVSVADVRTVADAPVDRAGPVPPDGTVVPLLVTVDIGGGDLPLVYPVTAGVRGGRWEVVALDPTAPLTGG